MSAGRGQQSRSIIVHLEVFTNRATQCVAPTQIYRTHRTWTLALVPVSFLCGRRHNLRFGIPPCRLVAVVVDDRSPGGLYKPGDACVAPTQIYRTHRTWTLALVPVSRGRRHNLRFGIPPNNRVDNRSPGGLYKPGDACVAPTQIYRTHRTWTLAVFRSSAGVHNLRFGKGLDTRCKECLDTKQYASPRQRQAPDKDRDSVPGRSMGAVSFVTPRMRKLQSKKR